MKHNKAWWKAVCVRAVRTTAQAAVAAIGTSVMMENVNWAAVISTAVLSGILSLLTGLAGLPEVPEE